MSGGKKIEIFNFTSKHDGDGNVIIDIVKNENDVFGTSNFSDVIKGNIEEATEVLNEIAKILGVSVTVGEKIYAGDKD